LKFAVAPKAPHIVLRLLAAAGLGLAAALLRYAIDRRLAVDTSYMFGVCAVLVSALLFRTAGPPLVTTFAVGAAWCFFFAADSRSGALKTPGDFIPLMRFLGVGVLFVAFQRALRKTEAELRRVNESLEKHVRERTAQLEARSEQLRALALDLAETESRERKRLAQVLHDHFQQLVSAAKMKVGTIRRRCPDETLIEPLRQTESLLDEALVSSRNLATELSPPVLYDVGLGAAIEWLGRHMEKNHNLAVKVDLERFGEPDNEQIRTIIFECARELLFNVAKHSGVKNAELNAWSPGDGLLHLSVIDRGRGFDTHHSQWRASPDGSFGLFSIRERLGLIGGLLKVVSAPGAGTTADITVPAIARRETSQIFKPTPPPAELAAEDPDRVFRILVADDHELFRESLVSLLEQKPYLSIVGEAGDGEEAVEMARKLCPDIMIVDVTMPKLNGVQVTAMLSREFPRMKIIGLSMHESQDLASAMRSAGASAYCVKNAPVESLINILRSAAAEHAAAATSAH
jgi:signal transduction histidine kinase/ActR/RegA family two-component response regulator